MDDRKAEIQINVSGLLNQCSGIADLCTLSGAAGNNSCTDPYGTGCLLWKNSTADVFPGSGISKEYGEDKSIGIYNFTENIGESLGPVVFGQLMFVSPLIRGVLPYCIAVTGMSGIYYFINRKRG